MDDDKTIEKTTYKLTIAGKKYEFGEPDLELLNRMVMIQHMNAGPLLIMEATTKWLAAAAGPAVWADIMKRFTNGEVTIDDLMKALGKLVKLVAGKQDSTDDAA